MYGQWSCPSGHVFDVRPSCLAVRSAKLLRGGVPNGALTMAL